MLGQRRVLHSLRRFLNTTTTIVEPVEVKNVAQLPIEVKNVTQSPVEVKNVVQSSVDPAEIGRFTNLASEWLDENGPMKILHAFNRVRIPWIVDELKKHHVSKLNEKEPLKDLKLLDVGSGCGILTFPLARLGAHVDGLEPSISCVQTTDAIKNRLLTEACRKRINFVSSTAEEHCIEKREAYDAIIVSEVVEHVADVPLLLQSCYKMAKPGALVFFSTINRTVLSRFIAVGLAETLGFVPKDTHDWNKFLTPDELSSLLRDQCFQVAYTRGLVYDPLLNEWDWFFSDLINYALLARKS